MPTINTPADIGRNMKEERDKFLTEAMGICTHTWEKPKGYIEGHICTRCNKYWPVKPSTPMDIINFSTWQSFGKLWEWAQRQEWWFSFWQKDFGIAIVQPDLIHPDRFSNAIYEFLKGRG
jgi:hypothetical protein